MCGRSAALRAVRRAARQNDGVCVEVCVVLRFETKRRRKSQNPKRRNPADLQRPMNAQCDLWGLRWFFCPCCEKCVWQFFAHSKQALLFQKRCNDFLTAPARTPAAENSFARHNHSAVGRMTMDSFERGEFIRARLRCRFRYLASAHPQLAELATAAKASNQTLTALPLLSQVSNCVLHAATGVSATPRC